MSRLTWILMVLCCTPTLALGDDAGFGWPSSNDDAAQDVQEVAEAPAQMLRMDEWRPSVPLEITTLRLEAVEPAPVPGLEDRVLDSHEAVLAAQEWVEVHGDLRIEGLNGNVTLPNLRSVTGSVRVDSVSGEWVSLPALERVGGDLVLSRSSVDVWDLPSVEHVGGNLTVSIVTTLRSLELPALISAEGVVLYQGTDLTQLSAPRLRTSSIDITQTQHLSTLEVPALEYADEILISETVLRDLSLDVLASVGQLKLSRDHTMANIAMPVLLEAGHLFVEDAPALTRIELPQVRAIGSLVLQSNAGLVSVSLPQLSRNGSVYAIYNDQLSSFSMPTLHRSDSVDFYSNASLAVRRVEQALRRARVVVSHECNLDDDCYEGGC